MMNFNDDTKKPGSYSDCDVDVRLQVKMLHGLKEHRFLIDKK